MKVKRQQSGLTIIELLVAAVVLSMLMTTGYYAYSIFAGSWQKYEQQVNEELSRYKQEKKLNAVLSGIVPWVVRRDNKQPAFFFVGKDKSLLAVTVNGLFSNESPEIFRLSLKNNEQNPELFDLVYQAKSTADIVLVSSSQEVVFDYETTLISAISDIQLRYYGWANIESVGNAEPKLWWNNYSGLNSQLVPSEIKFSLLRDNLQFSMYFPFTDNPSKILSSYYEDEAI